VDIRIAAYLAAECETTLPDSLQFSVRLLPLTAFRSAPNLVFTELTIPKR
jgi:hypothetical protein